MPDTITELLAATRTIAVVGASADPARPSHSITRFLIDAGYDVRPVNPALDELFGLAVHPDLDACGPVDLVDVFRRPKAVPEVVDAAARVRAGGVAAAGGREPHGRRGGASGGHHSGERTLHPQ